MKDYLIKYEYFFYKERDGLMLVRAESGKEAIEKARDHLKTNVLISSPTIHNLTLE